MKQADTESQNRRLRAFLCVSFGAVFLCTVCASVAAQTSKEDPSGILKGVTDQGLAYMTGGVGSGEREMMQSQAGDYNLKLSFADKSGDYLADVRVVMMDQNGKEIISTTTNGPWLYVELPPGDYSVEATYEDETKQIKNLRVTKDDRITRLVHWDLKEQA